MTLVYPIGLLALAGLLIPVLIHLWNVKKGKTLKIGSITFLGENATSSTRSLKLTDFLLFALRCLILILIAGLLAQPYLKKTNRSTAYKGWILVEKAQFSSIYKTHRSTIDSLLTKGFELHDFNVGFNSFSVKDSTAKIETSTALSYLALIQQLNTQMPKGYSAYIFADRRLVKFDGNLPKPNFNLIWEDVNYPDTIKTWSTTFLDKVYKGESTPSLTRYAVNKSQNLPVVTVAIYNPKGDDAKYIKAALNAITDFTTRKFETVTRVNEADVVFWLSDELIPSSVNKAFIYKIGKIENVNSTLLLSAESNQNIDLKKRIALDSLKGDVIWVDGWGQPMLIKENKTNHFYFYSRFNPQWNDLVWNEQFVKALIPIVLGNQTASDFGFEDHDADQRVLGQAFFQDSKIKTSGVLTSTTNQPLDNLIWGVAFILLIIERILSFRNKTKLENAKN
ncbi:MAG: BatA domain-containing protein [Bacteroidota bacterium]